jgi:hypothetical protein
MILCCFPLGIVAIVKASQVNSLAQSITSELVSLGEFAFDGVRPSDDQGQRALELRQDAQFLQGRGVLEQRDAVYHGRATDDRHSGEFEELPQVDRISPTDRRGNLDPRRPIDLGYVAYRHLLGAASSEVEPKPQPAVRLFQYLVP